MYNQDIIDIYGMNYFNNLVRSNTSFDFNNKDFNNIRLIVSFEHYLAKGVLENINRDYCIRYIRNFYNEFYKRPYLFADSILIRNKIVEEVLSGEELEKFRTFRSNYFSIDVRGLYNRNKNGELSEDEKNRFFSYLIVHLRSNNKQVKDLIDNVIGDIINRHKTIRTMNELELKFYCQYVANYALGHNNLNGIVCIGEASSNKNGQELNGLIFINRNSALPNIELMTKTVCHESRHYVQEHESKNKVNQTAFEMAQFVLFNKYLSDSSYDSYMENYRYSSIELDAERMGHWDAGVFFHMFHRVDLADKVSDNRRDKLDKRNYYEFMKAKDGKVFSVDKFVVTNMDQIIKAHPEELNNFPVLKQIYNSNGERKNFGDIIYTKITENNDNKGIVDNYIKYGIVHNELDSIQLNRVNKENTNKLFHSLSIVLRDTIFTLENYFRDTPDISMKGQVRTITLYQIAIIESILKYVEFNSEYLYNSVDEELSNRSLPFDFIIGLRDFSFSKIKNECLKDDPVVIDRMNNVLSTVNGLVKEFNKKYIISRLCILSSEQLRRCYPRSDMTFEDYMFNFVLPRMNSHLELEVNGKKYYVGSMIRNYAKMSEQEIMQTVDKLQF